MAWLPAAAGLLILAVLDGTFAGFRSSLGRTGLIEHRADDRLAMRRGGLLLAGLLSPTVIVASADAIVNSSTLPAYTRAGQAMLVVYLPYAGLVALALLGHLVLDWRQRYLATALILGPFTLLRPLVALAGAAVAAWSGRELMVTILSFLAVAAVLAVEPLADRLWYSGRPQQSISRPTPADR